MKPEENKPRPSDNSGQGAVDEDPFYGKGPHIQRFNVPTQANQTTDNLEESMFPEIGEGLEGMKDSPLDHLRSR